MVPRIWATPAPATIGQNRQGTCGMSWPATTKVANAAMQARGNPKEYRTKPA